VLVLQSFRHTVRHISAGCFVGAAGENHSVL